MKLWKKIAIVLVIIILLVQIPFIYNRYRFGQLADKINALQASRVETVNQNYKDLKGIIHAHTSLGGHSDGNFDELIQAAGVNNLDFVIMTEHTSALYDTSALTLHGIYNGALFINGQEVDTATDRFLQLPGDAETPLAAKMATHDYLQKIHQQNKLAVITYPEKFKTWDSNFDGIEVFSLHTNAKKMNPFFVFFDALWSYHGYPQLVLAKYFRRPNDNLKQFDEIAKTRRIFLTAGTDAHSNIGFHLFGDDANNKIINIKLDSYETIFRLVRNHVLLEANQPLNQENLLNALKNGHGYVAFDVLSDSKGFSFTAENGAGARMMGDEIALNSGVNLKSSAPLPARFIVFKNGEQVYEFKDTTQIEFQAKEPGAYRVEVYLESLGEPYSQMPWILSNPIYIR